MSEEVGGPLGSLPNECPCYRNTSCEFLQVMDGMRFWLTGPTKYCWWIELKADDPLSDLKKAREAINREIGRLEALKF